MQPFGEKQVNGNRLQRSETGWHNQEQQGPVVEHKGLSDAVLAFSGQLVATAWLPMGDN
jgi:hypothetical protein